jgi:hypothetical protein
MVNNLGAIQRAIPKLCFLIEDLRKVNEAFKCARHNSSTSRIDFPCAWLK